MVTGPWRATPASGHLSALLLARRSSTPIAVFNGVVITPNDAFFVRYHLADIPLSIDPDAFRIEVKGKVDRPLSLSLTDLKTGFEPVEIVAVNQCSGNGRGFFEPRVAGLQSSHVRICLGITDRHRCRPLGD